jgi:hypothetical protein
LIEAKEEEDNTQQGSKCQKAVLPEHWAIDGGWLRWVLTMGIK